MSLHTEFISMCDSEVGILFQSSEELVVLRAESCLLPNSHVEALSPNVIVFGDFKEVTKVK